jgi:hypothetical protein
MQQLGLEPGRPPKTESRLRQFLWPALRSKSDVEFAIHVGKVACFVVAAFAVLAIFLQESLAPLFDAVLFTGLGWGVGRKSRVCASIAFGLYFLSRLFVIISSGILAAGIGLGSTVLALALVVLLFHGMRGTFAHHRWS